MRIFRTRNSWKHDNIMEAKLGPGMVMNLPTFCDLFKMSYQRMFGSTPKLYQQAIYKEIPSYILLANFSSPWGCAICVGVVVFRFFQVRRVIRDECGSEIAVPWYFRTQFSKNLKKPKSSSLEWMDVWESQHFPM